MVFFSASRLAAYCFASFARLVSRFTIEVLAMVRPAISCGTGSGRLRAAPWLLRRSWRWWWAGGLKILVQQTPGGVTEFGAEAPHPVALRGQFQALQGLGAEVVEEFSFVSDRGPEFIEVVLEVFEGGVAQYSVTIASGVAHSTEGLKGEGTGALKGVRANRRIAVVLSNCRTAKATWSIRAFPEVAASDRSRNFPRAGRWPRSILPC